MWLDVNGKRDADRQHRDDDLHRRARSSPTVSEFMTLEPGDLITTGTPPGVGLGQKPEPWYLKAGDVVTLGIEKLGEQRPGRSWRGRDERGMTIYAGRFAGRTAIVTGGASGLGKASAERIVAEGGTGRAVGPERRRAGRRRRTRSAPRMSWRSTCPIADAVAARGRGERTRRSGKIDILVCLGRHHRRHRAGARISDRQLAAGRSTST